jgi:putative endonuclease
VTVLDRKARGELGERIAATFLTVKGYRILEKNIRYARREIDILACDGTALVAVEVKLRRGRRYGRAAEAVDRKKLARVRLALEGVASNREGTVDLRVDVVAIDFEEDLSSMVVSHLIGVY